MKAISISSFSSPRNCKPSLFALNVLKTFAKPKESIDMSVWGCGYVVNFFPYLNVGSRYSTKNTRFLLFAWTQLVQYLWIWQSQQNQHLNIFVLFAPSICEFKIQFSKIECAIGILPASQWSVARRKRYGSCFYSRYRQKAQESFCHCRSASKYVVKRQILPLPWDSLASTGFILNIFCFF